jgi:hypothetical protein
VYAVGTCLDRASAGCTGDGVAHFDGQTWSTSYKRMIPDGRAVWGIGLSEVYVLTQGSEIYRYR